MEHFKEVLNRGELENPVLSDEVYESELSDIIEEISVSEPTYVKQAIKRLKNGKASGTGSITAELLKANIEFSATKIHQLLGKRWPFGKITQAWKQGLIIKVPRKGNLQECKNSRGITLPFVVVKVLGRIIIERVRNVVYRRLRKEQVGYRKGRGTTDQIFTLRNIIEHVSEWQATTYLNFVDFEKAFDSIYRESLWVIMAKYGIPEKIVKMVRVFYDDFKCAVEDQGETCEWLTLKLV